jgi:hypothetical protein
MKKNIVIGLSVGLLLSVNCYAEYPETNLDYMGYGEEMIDLVDEEIGLLSLEDDEEEEIAEISEVESTVEQLKELGVSRSLSENMKDRSEMVREKNAEFWRRIGNREVEQPKNVVVSEETKALIKSNIAKALTDNGYKIVQLEVLPVAEYSTKNAVRAVVRVTKPMKTGSYKEVQSRLNSIKDICMNAATIDEHCMLSEMTTFIAENPKNKYYYEKTILR